MLSRLALGTALPSIILAVAALVLVAADASAAPSPFLSAEGERAKAVHYHLFDVFTKGRKTVYQGGGRDRGLKELTVLEERRVVCDGDEILLPAGSERVALLFRHFGFHGSGLDRIKEVRVHPFSPDKAPPRSAQLESFYRVQMPTLPVTDRPFDRMRIQVLMREPGASCRIDDVVFIAQKAISPRFDDLPYRDLGVEFPRERVEVEVDTDHELVIGGSADLRRDRWFRFHHPPGEVHESFEKWVLERGFLPGRGMFKFHPALTKGWGNMQTLKERVDRPGAADLGFFDGYDSGTRFARAIREFRESRFALCLNDWPDFMSVPLEGRGTPLTNRFDEAAELAAAYVGDQINDAGRSATWWEVKNESSVKSEWAHHWQEKKGIDGWGLLADFHNRVADAVHSRAPGVKVGGPASAYMQVQMQDFGLFRNQARFIGETRRHLDFFSHHFYENAGTLGAHARRGQGYSNYLLGRYEAILDMLRARMHEADNVLPILITETGSLQNGRRPSDNWLRLLAWSAYLTKSMQRPDQIDLFVPFIFLNMPWNPLSGDAAFTPRADRERHHRLEDFEPTPIASFFELWRDFDGRRLPVGFARDWLDVVAIHDGQRLSIAICNMGGHRVSVDLSKVAVRVGATGATQTRLNYHRGEVVFEPAHTIDTAAVPVDVNETTIVRLALGRPLKPAGALRLERHYAPRTAVSVQPDQPEVFEIGVADLVGQHSARLLVGVHRLGGVTEPLSVRLNGQPVVIDRGDAGEFSEFFAPLDADVPVSQILARNRIEIAAQKGTTITSVQLVTLRSDN